MLPGKKKLTRLEPITNIWSPVRNFSIAVGPVLGGLLANFFGFR